MPARAPNNIVAQVLESVGPSLSSQVCSALQQRGLSPDAARQNVSRAKPPVMRLRGMHFPHKESFVYLQSTYRTDVFWKGLLSAFRQTNSSYGIAVDAMELRGGLIQQSQFGTISGSPIRLRSHISSDRIYENLLKIGLIAEEQNPILGACVRLDGRGYFNVNTSTDCRAQLVAENISLLAIADWLKNLGMASYHKVDIRKTDATAVQPTFGPFQWDLVAPSYMHPLVSYDKSGKPTPGFVVCDVALSREVDAAQLAYFMNKCDLTRRAGRMRGFMAIFLATRFSAEAFRLGRSEGIVLATTENLFGTAVSAALQSLIESLQNAAAVAATNPEKIFQLFDALGKIEGAAGNLRGALFEMIVGHCVREKEGNSIEIGQIENHPKTGERAEIDVLRTKGNHEVAAYECKGYQPNSAISKEEIEKWLNKTIPTIRASFLEQKRFRNMEMIFEFWTCGQFSPEAEQLLQKAKSATKKYRLEWKDGKAVRDYAKSLKDSYAMKVLDEHYFKHPLTNMKP